MASSYRRSTTRPMRTAGSPSSWLRPIDRTTWSLRAVIVRSRWLNCYSRQVATPACCVAFDRRGSHASGAFDAVLLELGEVISVEERLGASFDEYASDVPLGGSSTSRPSRGVRRRDRCQQDRRGSGQRSRAESGRRRRALQPSVYSSNSVSCNAEYLIERRY